MCNFKEMEGWELRERVEKIKGYLIRGEVSYENARFMAIPVIAEMDRRGRIIAKKHGKKYQNISFSKLMR